MLGSMARPWRERLRSALRRGRSVPTGRTRSVQREIRFLMASICRTVTSSASALNSSTETPHLRVIDHDLWARVKARRATRDVTRQIPTSTSTRFRRAQGYVFFGLTKCSERGAGFVTQWRDRLACFND